MHNNVFCAHIILRHIHQINYVGSAATMVCFLKQNRYILLFCLLLFPIGKLYVKYYIKVWLSAERPCQVSVRRRRRRRKEHIRFSWYDNF
jgi:hypothetical protein